MSWAYRAWSGNTSWELARIPVGTSLAISLAGLTAVMVLDDLGRRLKGLPA